IGFKQILSWPYGKLWILGLTLVMMIFTPIVATPKWSIEKTYFNPDVLIYSQQLKEAVPRDAPCIILNDPSHYIFSYRIDKMGYVFSNDHLPIGWIIDMVDNYDVRFMYSDSEQINSAVEFQPFIKRIVTTQGSVTVFELQSTNK
ncbi:MAG: hypothetical protein AAFR14_03780, partial [Bacteroidota bacterium]